MTDDFEDADWVDADHEHEFPNQFDIEMVRLLAMKVESATRLLECSVLLMKNGGQLEKPLKDLICQASRFLQYQYKIDSEP